MLEEVSMSYPLALRARAPGLALGVTSPATEQARASTLSYISQRLSQRGLGRDVYSFVGHS